ncbi:MAG TPA: glycosyltransferase family 2 protein [Thermoanaerobaculia bacterium]
MPEAVRTEPVLSVVIASERVESLLPACLASLEGQADSEALEVVVASADPPPKGAVPAHIPVRWVRAASRNPAHRRNLAARETRGAALAFLDDDAEAEPGWASAGLAALASADIVGGPDLGPRGAPYAERLSDLLLATPWIGSGVPAHEWNPRGGPVRSAHDVALCNLFVRREIFERLGGFDEGFGYIGEDTDFVRRAMDSGARVVLEPNVRVRHRRRAFPGPYVAQRWKYRVKTGRLLVERPGLHARGRVTALLAAGFAVSAGAALFGLRFLAPAAVAYAALAWGCAFPIWRRDPALFPAVPFAFAVHHATYFAGLVAGISRGVFARRGVEPAR